jgi:hypothetical protein
MAGTKKGSAIMKTKEAAASTAAIENIEQPKSYRQTPVESRKILKSCIGETLLRLVTGPVEPDAWQNLELLMCQLYNRGAI